MLQPRHAAGNDAGLAIAQADVEGAGGEVVNARVQADAGAAEAAGEVFKKGDEGGAQSLRERDGSTTSVCKTRTCSGGAANAQGHSAYWGTCAWLMRAAAATRSSHSPTYSSPASRAARAVCSVG